jgi:hypothetical protein
MFGASRVWCLSFASLIGFRLSGFGFVTYGLQDLWFRFRVWDCRHSALRFRVCCSRLQGLEFRV